METLGFRSARAQKLPTPITTLDRFVSAQHYEQRMYVAAGDETRPNGGPSTVLGILKVGTKKLFVNKEGDSRMSEIEPCCVLDFYGEAMNERDASRERRGVFSRLCRR